MTALVIISAGIIKVYDLVVAQTSGGPGIASQVPALYVIDKMFGSQNLGLVFCGLNNDAFERTRGAYPMGLPRIWR